MNATTSKFEILTPKGTPTVGWIKYRVAERVEVKNGSVIAELEFPPDFIGDKVDVNAEFAFTMAFRGSNTANYLNVDPTLQHCIAAVHDAVLQFEGEFPGTSTEKGA